MEMEMKNKVAPNPSDRPNGSPVPLEEGSELGRKIEEGVASHLQGGLDAPKTSSRSLGSRFCNLWIIRKIVAFFRCVFCCSTARNEDEELSVAHRKATFDSSTGANNNNDDDDAGLTRSTSMMPASAGGGSLSPVLDAEERPNLRAGQHRQVTFAPEEHEDTQIDDEGSDCVPCEGVNTSNSVAAATWELRRKWKKETTPLASSEGLKATVESIENGVAQKREREKQSVEHCVAMCDRLPAHMAKIREENIRQYPAMSARSRHKEDLAQPDEG